MKLAILAQSYLFDNNVSVNGSLVQLHNLTQGFCDFGIEVHYVCTTKDKSKPKEEVLDGIHFHWIQSQTSFIEWKRIMPIYKNILIAINPNAIYVRGRNVLLFVAGNYANTYNKIYVWGTNGDDSAELYKNIKRLKNSKKNLIKKLLLYPLKAFEDMYINKGMRMPQYIVNQNRHQQKQTEKLLKKKGVIINSFYPSYKNVGTSSKNQVLWLARWSKEKQPELFIDIISRLNQPYIKFIMAGGSSDSISNKILMEKSKEINIETPGEINYKEVKNYFEKSLIFVNTSYREGVSNTFIEAMLNGVPVLSLNSNPNNWLTDFNIGYCSNGSVDKLAKKINELLSNRDELQQMSNNAKTFALNQFSNNKIIKSYIKLFKGNG